MLPKSCTHRGLPHCRNESHWNPLLAVKPFNNHNNNNRDRTVRFPTIAIPRHPPCLCTGLWGGLLWNRCGATVLFHPCGKHTHRNPTNSRLLLLAATHCSCGINTRTRCWGLPWTGSTPNESWCKHHCCEATMENKRVDPTTIPILGYNHHPPRCKPYSWFPYFRLLLLWKPQRLWDPCRYKPIGTTFCWAWHPFCTPRLLLPTAVLRLSMTKMIIPIGFWSCWRILVGNNKRTFWKTVGRILWEPEGYWTNGSRIGKSHRHSPPTRCCGNLRKTHGDKHNKPRRIVPPSFSTRMGPPVPPPTLWPTTLPPFGPTPLQPQNNNNDNNNNNKTIVCIGYGFIRHKTLPINSLRDVVVRQRWVFRLVSLLRFWAFWCTGTLWSAVTSLSWTRLSGPAPLSIPSFRRWCGNGYCAKTEVPAQCTTATATVEEEAGVAAGVVVEEAEEAMVATPFDVSPLAALLEATTTTTTATTIATTTIATAAITMTLVQPPTRRTTTMSFTTTMNPCQSVPTDNTNDILSALDRPHNLPNHRTIPKTTTTTTALTAVDVWSRLHPRNGSLISSRTTAPVPWATDADRA